MLFVKFILKDWNTVFDSETHLACNNFLDLLFREIFFPGRMIEIDKNASLQVMVNIY